MKDQSDGYWIVLAVALVMFAAVNIAWAIAVYYIVKVLG